MTDAVEAIAGAAIIAGAAYWINRRINQPAAPAQPAAIVPAVVQTPKQGNDMFVKTAFKSLFEQAFKATPALQTPAVNTPFIAAARPATPAATGEPANIGAQLKRDLMATFGLTGIQAAGVVGNLDHESAGFKSLQEIKPLIAGSRGGYGYAQWTGPRRRSFEAWVQEHGLDARSYAANLGFLKHELTNTEERRVLPRLRKARTVEDATRIFSGSSERGNSFDGFLRPGIPHMASRIARARKYV
jgi:hypothetical protein